VSLFKGSIKNKVVSGGKFSFSVLFYFFSLSIITITVFLFLSDFHNRNQFTIDLIKQKNSIAVLQTKLAETNENIIKLIYFNDKILVPTILSSTEDFQFALDEFVGIAEKHNFILDLSLYTEVDSSFYEMRELSFKIVREDSIDNKEEAIRIFKEQYLRYENIVTQFTVEALYDKIKIIDSLMKKNEKRKAFFAILFLSEIVFTLVMIFLIHRWLSSKLFQSNQKLSKLANFDDLTGLYNRRMLIDYLEHTMALSRRTKRPFGLFYFDLDGFKKINDVLGHNIGDKLLQQVADRLRHMLRESEILARIGGDEFVLLIQEVRSVDHLEIIAKKIIAVFEADFNIEKKIIHMVSSVGITFNTDTTISVKEVLQNADAAMYSAKDSGGNCFRFYSDEMNAASRIQMEMESDIERALKNNEFAVFYQPQIDPLSGTVCSAEALIRWIHPEKGFVQPNDFILIAEKSDLIIEIDQWVRKEVCRQLTLWKDNDFPLFTISVNISPREFIAREVYNDLEVLFSDYDIERHYLELEITENTLLHCGEQEDTGSDLKAIRSMGFGLSIDDFGKGYCSIGYLKQFPVDKLKIDKTFINDCVVNKRDGIIVKTIISMAKSLGMSVVAEGVETVEQLEFLIRHGCNLIQGYYYSRPLPCEEFEQYVLTSCDDQRQKKNGLKPVNLLRTYKRPRFF